MAKEDSKVETLLQNLIMVQLALAGVPGAEIRRVAGVKMRYGDFEGGQKGPGSIAPIHLWS